MGSGASKHLSNRLMGENIIVRDIDTSDTSLTGEPFSSSVPNTAVITFSTGGADPGIRGRIRPRNVALLPCIKY